MARFTQYPAATSPTDYTDATNFLIETPNGDIKLASLEGLSTFFCSVQCSSLTVASADVLTGNSSPVAFGLTVASGTAVQIISATGSMTYNSTPYATNGDIVIRCVGANSGQVGFDDNGFLFGTVSRTVPASYVMSDGTTDTFLIDGADLEFYVEGGDPTAGDSDITVQVLYRVITL